MFVREQVPLEPGAANTIGDVASEKTNVVFLAVEKACLLRRNAADKLQAELQGRDVGRLRDEITVGYERSMEFARCGFRVGDMLEHVVANDEVETVVGKLHPLAIDA